MNSGEDVSVNYVFQPMVNPLGRIVAVECLSRIMDKKHHLIWILLTFLILQQLK